MKQVKITFTLNGNLHSESIFPADQENKQISWMKAIKKQLAGLTVHGNKIACTITEINFTAPKTAPNSVESAKFTISELMQKIEHLKKQIAHQKSKGSNPEYLQAELSAAENHVQRLKAKYLDKTDTVIAAKVKAVKPQPSLQNIVTFEGCRYIFHPDYKIFANLDMEGKYLTLADVRTLLENELLTIDATEIPNLKKYIYATA